MGNNSTERRVVVTGLGIVSPLGNDISTFWENLVAGRCGVDKITGFDPSKFDTQIAAEVKDFNPLPAFPTAKEVRRADRFGQFGVYAGWKALQDSGLDLNKVDLDEVARSSVQALAASGPYPTNIRFCSNAVPIGSRRS